MNLNELTAISPIDGRYRKKVEPLSEIFSEYGLIKRRVGVEIVWLAYLVKMKLPQLSSSFSEDEIMEFLWPIYSKFSEENAMHIKVIEKKTNHDVKAIEYFLKEIIEASPYVFLSSFIHFGLTSEDTDNLARTWQLYDGTNVLIVNYTKISDQLTDLSKKHLQTVMLGLTHGQPALPTTFGKEVKVFDERMLGELETLCQTKFKVKIGGATGTLAALCVAYPEINWRDAIETFIAEEYTHLMSWRDNNNIIFEYNMFTTQVEPKDSYAACFQNIMRINTILIDFCRDIWSYISFGWIKQIPKEGEVGSSTMPQKVNPINFENAEGSLGVANTLFGHFCEKLPVSRLQRDLSCSAVQRYFGTAVAPVIIACDSILTGLDKISIDEKAMAHALDDNWAIITEGIQTILRREKYPNPYEAMKKLTRGKEGITKETIHVFIDSLEVSDKVKEELKGITPRNYIGNAATPYPVTLRNSQ